MSAEGRWFFSPGFTNQFDELVKNKGYGRYRLSFWVRNQESKFLIKTEAIRGKEAISSREKKLIEENRQIDDWQLFHSELNVKENQGIRVELNILEPGVFSIDDFRIEKL